MLSANPLRNKKLDLAGRFFDGDNCDGRLIRAD